MNRKTLGWSAAAAVFADGYGQLALLGYKLVGADQLVGGPWPVSCQPPTIDHHLYLARHLGRLTCRLLDLTAASFLPPHQPSPLGSLVTTLEDFDCCLAVGPHSLILLAL